ncbi:beta-glucoside-specific PTS transporter subunit IIABC [Fusibacter sp. 3D3]|uniref:beta-glucoside-specific PTS transporter subunit IIABC n=1 Tax=Fusibacter sp. 3D3 TaxID=1048380 RepID=UPI00085324FA|nr:beta-glucoside-specific PTS transporter subunit IIABC [Fusibacter sp. 3D3]GAU78397.1 beta-glucoside-specific IIB component [Fusibacter sp. 3D3]
MDYQNLAKEILEKVGGAGNITGIIHCATRLRLNLADESKAKDQALKNVPGIMGVVKKGGQFQIVIGSDVASVYKPLMEMADIKVSKGPDQGHKKILDRLIDTLTGIFTPILPAITAAGMIKAILAILVTFKVVTNTSQAYQILNFMADAGFYFLPILLASSAAHKFKCNPYMAMMLGGILLHPSFIAMVAASKESGEAIKLFSLPISNAGYASSVLPIILIVWFMSYVEPIADKISPKAVKFFTKPLLTILVTGIAGLVLIGPLGYILSSYVASVMNGINEHVGWLAPMLIGIFSPLLVMTGTHYGIIPIAINNRMTIGYDTLLYPGMLGSNVAQGGAALAVSIKSKKPEIKQLASSAGITAVCGITEPALYGINMKYKTPMYAAMIGGGIGGLFMGITKVRNYSGGSPGLLTLPSYIGGDNMNSFYFACIGAAMSIAIAFIVTMVIYKDPIEDDLESLNDTDASELKAHAPQSVLAPIAGKVVALSEVNDSTFSDEIVGKGAAIIPSEGKVVAPVDGKIVTIFNTKHAIAIQADSGAEILIHVGIDTVKLEGKYFEVFKNTGDTVKKGDLIATFDIEGIKSEGFDVITPVVITNHDSYVGIKSVDKVVKTLDTFIEIN